MHTQDPGDPTALADELADRFEDRHGRPPEAVLTAPGRVNLIGEHVDYNGGLCLPLALPHATYAAAAARDDGVVAVTSAQADDAYHGRVADLDPERIDGWAAYAVGVLWALREEGWDLPGMDLEIDSRVPLGAGLSSSAAIECSVALAAAELTGRRLDDDLRSLLVRASMRAEEEVAGAPTGGMDQTVSLFAQAQAALLIDCRDWSLRQVGWDPAAAGLTPLIIDTRASHSLTDGGYAARRRDCESAAEILGVETLREVTDQRAALETLTDERVRRRVRHVFTEIDRVRSTVALLDRDDLEDLGSLMNDSHVSLRDDYEVSCPELDVAVEQAISHGALGARMTGGGFGGSAVALVPTDAVDEVGHAVEAAYQARDWPAPRFLTALPSDGARRLR